MGKRAWWAGVVAVGLAAPWALAPRSAVLPRPDPAPVITQVVLVAPVPPAAKISASGSSVILIGKDGIAPVTASAIPFASAALVDAPDLTLSPYVAQHPAEALESTAANDDQDTSPSLSQPVMLSLASSDDDSVFSLPTAPQPGQGTNMGGVHLDLTTAYLNHYVYRGVDHSITSPKTPGGQANTKAKSLNLETNGKLEFDLGKLPHPFVGLFANIYDRDPKSRFQEIRPYYGAEWTIRPFTIEGGGITYIYPERERRNTAEAYGKFSLNDAFIFNTEKPIFSPYIYGAYDYDKNNGWYFEAGVTHDLQFEDLGLTLTFQGDAAYIIGFQQQFVFTDSAHDTGFQHYDVGMTARYSLNHVLNFSTRYGEFDVLGYLFYTGKLDKDIRADNVLWGGAGIGFKY